MASFQPLSQFESWNDDVRTRTAEAPLFPWFDRFPEAARARREQHRAGCGRNRGADELRDDEAGHVIDRAMPANVVVRPRASVTAGLAKLVEDVNQ